MRDKFPIDDSMFDRLVDGELSPDERRQLLTSLDDQPDGWRRWEQRLLEAQAWGDGWGQFVRGREEDRDAETSLAAARDAPLRTSTKRGLAWLAIAAGLLLAFTRGK